MRAIRAHRPRAIYATGNPYSSFLLARLVGAASRRPYVLDFRDAWTLNWYSWRFQPGADRWRARIEAAQERWALRGAAAAIFMSEQVRDDYAAAYPELTGRLHKLSNGFDPDDFAGVAPRPLEGFAFVYTGKLMSYRPPDPFLRGLAAAVAREPALGEAARAYFVGDWRAEHQASADALGIGRLIRPVAYVPHREAVAHMLGASALALISGGDRTEQPGKVFEYLAAGRPILALIPEDGASAEVVRASPGGGYFADPADPDGVAAAILRLWAERGRPAAPADTAARDRYDRRVLTGRLAEILARVAGG
jgi:glycosyltransferase involved in cell wall biosynthesis